MNFHKLRIKKKAIYIDDHGVIAGDYAVTGFCKTIWPSMKN